MKQLQLKILLAALCCVVLYNSQAQHFIGIKNSYNINTLEAVPTINGASLKTSFNPGIFYRYDHKKYFAVQLELSYLNKGYVIELDTAKNITPSEHYVQSIELPFMGRCHINGLGNFKPYLTGGALIGYILGRQDSKNGVKTDYDFTDIDRRFEFGVIVGGGVSYGFSHFDVHLAGLFTYNFSFLQDPLIPGKNNQYFNFSKLGISLGLAYRLGK